MGRTSTILLLAFGLVGGVVLIRQRLILSEIKPEYRKLIERYGEFEIDDERQFHIQRVETEDDQIVEWRFFRPSTITGTFGFGFSDVSPYGSQFFDNEPFFDDRLVRCCFELEDDQVSCHLIHLFGAQKYIFAKAELAFFICSNWSKLEKDFILSLIHI